MDSLSAERWTTLGTAVAGAVVLSSVFRELCPDGLKSFLCGFTGKVAGYVSRDIHITFPELTGEKLKPSEAYRAIQNYLASRTSTATWLKADHVKGSQNIILSLDDEVEVSDFFEGKEVRWFAGKITTQTQAISFRPSDTVRRYYRMSFRKRYRDIITSSYIPYVLEEGKAAGSRNRRRKLYTNSSGRESYYNSTKWKHVPFEHPASFDTLAMPAKKKEAIMKDLIRFSQGERYYKKIGKPWKRGYLLYGPPGTGKSTMIAAMANFLNYDVYDLELTTVQNNSELRALLIETSGKALIVIEDIDCSLDLTGKRTTEKGEDSKDAEDQEEEFNSGGKGSTKVTLSGLLNFIDGIWSACEGEKIIVFTTNYVDKLDPALIRRGRMDMHIEMSYCCFEAFKVLAKNYLDVEEHERFKRIEELLGETNMSPADVAENLMPKSEEADVDSCLAELVEALEAAKLEEAKRKLEEERKLKARKEAEEKKENQKEEGKEKEGTKVDGETQTGGCANLAVTK